MMRDTARLAEQADPERNHHFRRVWETPAAELQRQRGCEHLAGLGARALHGFLADLEMQIGGGAVIDRLLAEYRARLTPQLLETVGGDRFPPHLREVPG